MPDFPKNFRKAAILVASLEDSLARKLLDRLDPEQANKVRRAAEQILDVQAEEREETLREFTLHPASSATAHEGGVEIDSSLAKLIERAFEDDTEDSIIDNTSSNSLSLSQNLNGQYLRPETVAERKGFETGNKGIREPESKHEISGLQSGGGEFQGASNVTDQPFAFIESADIETVGALLKQEHPQTIALIVSRLPAERAASIVMQLSTSAQVEVLRRLSSIEASDPESVEVLARELRVFVQNVQQQEEQKQRGIATVHNILESIDSKSRSSLLVRIQQRDGDLASKLGFSIQSPNQASKLSRNTKLDFQKKELKAQSDELAPVLKNASKNEKQVAPIQPAQPSAAISRTIEKNRHNHEAQSTLERFVTDVASPVPFENLIHLEDITWQKLLIQAEPELLSLALTMADSDLVDRVATFLPKIACVTFKKSLRAVGPTRLADIESARQELSRLAGLLVQHSPATREVFQQLA